MSRRGHQLKLRPRLAFSKGWVLASMLLNKLRVLRWSFGDHLLGLYAAIEQLLSPSSDFFISVSLSLSLFLSRSTKLSLSSSAVLLPSLLLLFHLP